MNDTMKDLAKNPLRIRELLENYRNQGKKAFIPYITAGDPNLDATIQFVQTLTRAGADIIELGIPYSDPIADGPTNLKAAERALKNRVTLQDCVKTVGKIRAAGCKTPIVVFTYYNPILRMGYEAFASLAQENAVDAVLLVDLPLEESAVLRNALHSKGVGTIFLASPTTPPERMKLVEECSSEFIYYVSRVGVTGAKASLSETLVAEVAELRRQVSLPIAVGFGISTPEHSKAVAKIADAVVVGSALVRVIEDHPDQREADRKLYELAHALCAPLK